MIYPENIEQKIDFQVIRDGLKGCCMSGLGKERVDAMQWLTHFPAVSTLLARVREMMALLSDPALAFPHGEIYDLREALSRIRIEGLYMDESELFSLRKMLDYAAQLERFFATLDKAKYPLLSQEQGTRSKDLSVTTNQTKEFNLGSIILVLDSILDRYGKMRDNASPELARIRKEISASQGSVSRALNAILRQAQAEGILDKDAAPTMREGRLVLPVPPAYKRKIGGIVHDESATGKTVFIEPQQVVEANNRIRELEGEERRERIRILLEITEQLRPKVPQIMDTENYLGEVDFLRAKALFAIDIHAIVPEVSRQPMIDWREAYHPVLLLNFRRQGKTVVPLTIRLLGERRDANGEGVVATPMAVATATVTGEQMMLTIGTRLPHYTDGTFEVLGTKYQIADSCVYRIGSQKVTGDDLVRVAQSLKNVSYLWGGKNMMGYDCSGFTQTVYSVFGINLLRNAREQVTQGQVVSSLAEAQPGDLVFFDHSDRNPEATKITHVGMLISPTEVIHCAGYVHVDKIDEMGIRLANGKLSHHLVQIKRYL